MIGIIIGFLLTFYLILAIYRLDLAVLAMIFALPSYLIRFAVFGIPMTFLEGMILIAFAVWFVRELRPFKFDLIKYVKDRKSRTSYPFKWEIILFLLVSWIALAVAHFDAAALGVWKAYFIEPILVFILVINVLKKEGIGKIVWALALSALAISLFAIYQKITGQFIANAFWAAAVNRRVVSFFDFPNAVGLYLGPIILLLAGFLVGILKSAGRQKKLNAAAIFLIIALSVLAVCFAQSKGALVGITAGLFVYGILADKKIRLATLAIAVIAVIGVIGYPPAFKQAKNLVSMSTLSGQIRQQQWIETKKMLAAGYWFWGAGLSGYQAAVAPFHQAGIFIKTDDPDWLHKILTDKAFRDTHWQPTEIYMYPHNIFLNFWTELGLMGLMLMVWIIGKYLLLSWRAEKYQKKNNSCDYYLTLGFLSAMIVIIVHGFVDVPYFKNDLSVMFWILLAVVGLYGLDRRLIE